MPLIPNVWTRLCTYVNYYASLIKIRNLKIDYVYVLLIINQNIGKITLKRLSNYNKLKKK